MPLRPTPLDGAPGRYDPLLELVGEARLVLIGEASHGTEEFYAERAAITRRLIEERGFLAVAAEADWPDAYRVNCYVRGTSDDRDAGAALGEFRRFPAWMWRNMEVLRFVEWLRGHNLQRDPERRAGFYGIDLYSLYGSIEAVIRYLDRVDPEAAARARDRYACFEHFGADGQRYGHATAAGAAEPCEDEVVAQLTELRRRAAELADGDGRVPEDAHFFAEQNARLVRDAERYYRAMLYGRAESWNLRDTHMADSVEALGGHLSRDGRPAKIVVWAHNSHLGDAGATEMGERGELNVGQLVRQRHGEDVRLIGFTTHHGTVTASSAWDGPAERKRVRPALPGSWEALFHESGIPRFLLDLRRGAEPAGDLDRPRLERAIGVIYRPASERLSHYFDARIAGQFDAVVHIDETTALEPLERTSGWEAGEAPETFPTGV